jgi:hypothetical protein
MRKASFADMYCSVAQTLEIIGEWWTLLILRDVFLGVRRFDDFVERLGISRNILTNRLGAPYIPTSRTANACPRSPVGRVRADVLSYMQR